MVRGSPGWIFVGKVFLEKEVPRAKVFEGAVATAGDRGNEFKGKGGALSRLVTWVWITYIVKNHCIYFPQILKSSRSKHVNNWQIISVRNPYIWSYFPLQIPTLKSTVIFFFRFRQPKKTFFHPFLRIWSPRNGASKCKEDNVSTPNLFISGCNLDGESRNTKF